MVVLLLDRRVISGVVLGPLLFVTVYTVGLHTVISLLMTPNFVFWSRSLPKVTQRSSNGLDKVFSWSQEWQMLKFNIDKLCKVMHN